MKVLPSTQTLSETLHEIRLDDYVARHSDPEPPVLRELRHRANLNLVYPRMVSGHIQGRLLKMLVRMIRPRHILEIGTFAAYATICMAEALPEEARITTIEVDEELESFIEKSLTDAGVRDRVELVIADAEQLLQELDLSRYDLVYLDANKRQYPRYYELLMAGLPSGAFILADNTLWGGKVPDPELHDPQTDGIRAFNTLVADDERVEKVLLPVRDGLTLIHKR